MSGNPTLRRTESIQAKEGVLTSTQSRPELMDLSSSRQKEQQRCGGVRSGWKRGGEGLAGVCLAAAA